ncbi:MAG TPA: bifunctional DNA primase/polymerase [Candidatus Levybacteria bacterium]|nr:bifunctional DNA primase/polymerase [Candidatus Levybacteria bacterium]
MENKNTKLEQALLLRDIGWSIIPVDSNKKPLIKWEEYQKRIPSIDEIEKWFSQWPNANIGIVTGSISKLIVVDIDPRHGGTNELFKEYKTPCSITGGGGWHYYFTSSTFITNRAGVLPGIDIRGEGGYVIAPPSIHSSGGSYKWLITPREATISEFPSWIFQAVEKKQDKNDWQTVLSGVSEGERNTSAARVIGKLLSVFPSSEWEEFVLPLITDWNNQNNPPLSEQELIGIYKSLSEKEAINREDNSDALHLYREVAAMQWKEPVLISSLSKEQTPVEWIWEGFLAEGQTTIISSLWKTGKTTLICWLLKNISDQEQFLGKDTKNINVLIISEESEALWASRKEEYQLGTNIWLSCRPLNRKTNTQQWIQFISKTAEFCVENQIGLVIVDTLATFWPVRDENDATQVTSALLPLNSLLENKLAVMIVHHERKSGGEEGTSSRGSGALPAYVDIIVEFRRFDPSKRDDTRRVIKTYSRYAETPTELVLELTPEGYDVHGTKAQVVQQEKLSVVLEILPTEPASYSIDKILSEWPEEEYGKPPHKTTMYRWLQKLKEQGSVKVLGTSTEHNADLWSKAVALQGEVYKDAKEEAK